MNEDIFAKLDQYAEYLEKLMTVQLVGAIPREIGQVLYDDYRAIDRYHEVFLINDDKCECCSQYCDLEEWEEEENE